MADPETRVLVRALQTGFYGGSRVRAGTTFSILPHEMAKWMEPADPGSVDALAAAREASPKVRGSAGVTLKVKPKAPPPGGRRGLEPESGI